MKDRQVSLKKALIVSVLCCLMVSCTFAYVAYAAASDYYQVISGGRYPSASAWTVYNQDGTYYAKNAWGGISYSSTNAATIFNTLCAINGATIDVAEGTYTFTESIVMENSWVTIKGTNAGYTYFYASSESVTPLFKIYARVTLENLDLRLESESDTAEAIHIYGVYSGGDAIRPEFKNVLVRNFGYGLYCDGVHYATLTDCDFYNCLDSVYITGSGLGNASQFVFFNQGNIEKSRNSPITINYGHHIVFDGTYIGEFEAPVSLKNFKEVNFYNIQFEPFNVISCIEAEAGYYHQNLNILQCGFSTHATNSIELNDVNTCTIDDVLISFTDEGTTFLTATNCTQTTLGKYSTSNAFEGLLTEGSVTVNDQSGFTRSGSYDTMDSSYKAANPMFISTHGLSATRADASILITENGNVTKLKVYVTENTFNNVCAIGIWNGTSLVNFSGGDNIFLAGVTGNRTITYTNFPVHAGDVLTPIIWAGASTSSGSVTVGMAIINLQD